jgi:hypothetical protein
METFYFQKEKPEIEPVPHKNPEKPIVPEVVPTPEKSEPQRNLPETEPIHQPEIIPNPDK